MPDDPKGGIGLLFGLKPKGKTDAETDDDDDDASAGQAALDAIEAKDPKALEAAIRLCYESHDDKKE